MPRVPKPRAFLKIEYFFVETYERFHSTIMSEELTKISKKNQTENLLCGLKYSDFGEIKKIMSTIFSSEELENEYKLPKILMIGGESAGKSSVLENITKCHIFPRDAKTCTKCPVKVLLNNSKENALCKISINEEEKEIPESEIYTYLDSYMKTLKDIVDYEITLKITKKNYPNIELYDLPGIVAHPPEKSKKSLELVKKYLEEDNAIIICTVPATSERINGHHSVALIKEYKKETDTILVLTKIDKVTDDDLKPFVIDRILGKDDEIKELDIPFCVGIQNRTHRDKVSLLSTDKKEEETIQYIEGYYQHEPDCKEYLKNTATIENFLGIDNLIKIICDKYMMYVVDKWIPKIVQKINDNIILLQVELSNIGYMFTQDVFRELLRQNLHKYLQNSITKFVHNYNKTLKFKDHANYLIYNGFAIDNHIKFMDVNVIANGVSTDLINTEGLLYSKIVNETEQTEVLVNLQIHRYTKAVKKIVEKVQKIMCSNHELLLENASRLITIYEYYHLSGDVMFQEVFDKYIISSLMFGIEESIDVDFITEVDLIESNETLLLKNEINEKIKTLENNIKKITKVKNKMIN
jgi:GTP-binding protein EngB required for normal cell division